ncbi:MAG: class I SAM-dependent methyltransferase [Lysobacteraceae bacterium]|nr:MAG: class I SAM-dependent methyltransferase [Xanthomonadaceae bacterium]
MASHPFMQKATSEDFDEQRYLRANPDVAAAVRAGSLNSGLEHFTSFGQAEGRRQAVAQDLLAQLKQRKLERIRPLLRTDLPCVEAPRYFDFLSEDLRDQFRIIDTEAVSSNGYDGHVMALIHKHEAGLVLDCGAGSRTEYFDNVVNFEIADYDSTDVRGVGEVLPFQDGVFDAVISIAVLEHVKDPFLCAKEIVRVLKPGGELICCVPFLQPLHGYPHHYYNMTHQGLENLYRDSMAIDRVEVYDSVLPIWSLSWMLTSWAAGLEGSVREDFLQMRVADLMDDPMGQVHKPFVRNLSAEVNRELASANVLFAHKPTGPVGR